MGALTAVLAIPYRSIKESIERNRKNKHHNKIQDKDKRQTKSAPGSRTASLYTIGAGTSFEKKNKLGFGLGRGYSEGKEGKAKSQSLGHLPLVDVPRAQLSSVSSVDLRRESLREISKGKGKGKGKEREESSLRKQSTRVETTAPIPVVA